MNGKEEQFEFVYVGECFSQVESNEDQVVQETPPTKEDRWNSPRNDDETQLLGTFILYDLIVWNYKYFVILYNLSVV